MKKMTAGEIVGGSVGLFIIAGVAALYATGENTDPPPLTWHYIGPASKDDLTKQAVGILTDACPRLIVYNEYIEKPNVVWRIVDRPDPLWRSGVRAAVNVSTRFKAKPVDPKPHMPIYPLDMFDGQQPAVFILAGPPVNSIIISGRGGMTLCDVADPPIGDAPSIKPANQLSGLTP